jgi:hypothetical protein
MQRRLDGQQADSKKKQPMMVGGTSWREQARIIVEVEARPARFGSYRKPMGVWGCFRIYRPD